MAIIIIAPARFCRQEFHLFLLTQELQGRLRHHDHDLTILIILLILPIQSQVVLLERRLLKGKIYSSKAFLMVCPSCLHNYEVRTIMMS